MEAPVSAGASDYATRACVLRTRGAHLRILGAAIIAFLLAACGMTLPPTPDRTAQVHAPWVLTSMAGNRLELAVMVAGADCERFVDVEVIESDQDVELRAWVEEVRQDGCFLVRGYDPVTVELSSPLGERRLGGCLIEESPPHDTRESCAELVDL